MKSLHTILALGLVLGFASISSPGDSQKEESSLHGFPLAPSARHWCEGQDLGTKGTEILWDALTSPEPPEKLAAFYTKRLGKEALKDKGSWIWRMPAGQPQPDSVLSLDPVTADGPWTQCSEPIPSDARTVLLLSTMLRRSP